MSDKGSRSGTPKASSRKSSKAGTPKGSKSGTPKGSKSNTPLPTDPQAMEITEEEALAAGACKWFPQYPTYFSVNGGLFFSEKTQIWQSKWPFCRSVQTPTELLRSVQTPTELLRSVQTPEWVVEISPDPWLCWFPPFYSTVNYIAPWSIILEFRPA